MKQKILRWLVALLLTAAMTACGDSSRDYADRAEIRDDLDRLYQAREKGDEVAIMTLSKRLLASKQTIGAVRMTPLIFSAEVLARRGQIEEVNSLFEKQFPLITKSTGDCGQAVFSAMKAEVWQTAGRLDLAVADYNAAIDKCPKLDNAYSKLSLLYSNAATPEYRDAAKALALAQKAVEIHRSSQSLNAAAVAHAAAGKYDLAVANLQQAVEAAQKERQPPERIEALRSKLSDFQAKAVR